MYVDHRNFAKLFLHEHGDRLGPVTNPLPALCTWAEGTVGERATMVEAERKTGLRSQVKKKALRVRINWSAACLTCP